MPYVNAPPGLRQLRMYDGTVIPVNRATGRMDVSNPDHVKAIDAMGGNGTAGLVTAQFRVFGSSPRAGRWCTTCTPARLWNAWNDTCPRCGSATSQE